MTDLANSCVTTLFRRPQGSQGCLEKQNHPLSSNLVVWCAKIGPKTKKVQKTSDLTKKCKKCKRTRHKSCVFFATYCREYKWIDIQDMY